MHPRKSDWMLRGDQIRFPLAHSSRNDRSCRPEVTWRASSSHGVLSLIWSSLCSRKSIRKMFPSPDRSACACVTWSSLSWSAHVNEAEIIPCAIARIASSHCIMHAISIFDSVAIRAPLIRPPSQTIFQRSTRTYIDLSTPSSSCHPVHVPWRKRHCYEKEMVLLWRYCSLGYVGSRHDCRNKSYLIRDRTGLPSSLLPFLLTKWSDIIFSSLLSFTRERIVYSMSLNLATRREVSIAVGTVGVVFSATDLMPRCLDCLEASSWILDYLEHHVVDSEWITGP